MFQTILNVLYCSVISRPYFKWIPTPVLVSNISPQLNGVKPILLLTRDWIWLHPDLLFSNYWMRLSRIRRILQIKEGVIHRGRRPRWITPSEICRILHILRKPNSTIALLFIKNIYSILKEFRHFALFFCSPNITQPCPQVFVVNSSII